MNARTALKMLAAGAALSLALPAIALAWSGSARNYGTGPDPSGYSYNQPTASTADMATTDGYGSSQPAQRDVSPDDYSFGISNMGTTYPATGPTGYGSSMPPGGAMDRGDWR